MKRCIVFSMLAFAAVSVRAQYPTIPPALQDSTDKAQAKLEKLSDAAWEQA